MQTATLDVEAPGVRGKVGMQMRAMTRVVWKLRQAQRVALTLTLAFSLTLALTVVPGARLKESVLMLHDPNSVR